MQMKWPNQTQNKEFIYIYIYIYILQVALVSQEPVLFARSVQMNISYGVSEAPMETVLRAAYNANAHDFITGLSKGYETG